MTKGLKQIEKGGEEVQSKASLADPGKARGSSTKTVIMNYFTEGDLSNIATQLKRLKL